MRYLFIQALVGAMCVVPIVRAQAPPASVDPGAVQQHSSETDRYYQLQNRIDRNTKTGGTDPLSNRLAERPPAPAGRSEGALFALQSVETNASAILTKEQLSPITAKYLGRQVSVQDLNAIVADINAFYKSHGYVTAMAILPRQTVVAGVVHIQLIEAKLGKIVVKDNQHTKSSYFIQRVACQPGDLVQVDQIQKSLAFFNATNDVKVKAVLEPGQEFGTTDLTIDVQPTPVQSTSFSLDDAGLASTGRQRIGSTETIRSLFGYRDPLTAGAYWSNGMWAGFASYDFPLTAGGLRLGPEFSYDNIRIRQSALQKLGVNGTFYDVSLKLSRPFVATDRLTVTGYLAPHFQESTLRSQDYRISNIPVRSLEFGASLQAPDKRGFWGGNVFASGGDYNLLGLKAFVKFGGSGTRVQNLGRGFVAVLRAQGQGKAADPSLLPPSQQFQIGGLSSARGYPEGAFIGDAGYAASAELDAPMPFSKTKIFGVPWGQRIRWAAFVDHAGLLGAKPTFLTGTGGGLIVNLSHYLEGRVYAGTPLEERSQYKHVQIHFALQSTPQFPAILQRLRGRRE